MKNKFSSSECAFKNKSNPHWTFFVYFTIQIISEAPKTSLIISISKTTEEVFLKKSQILWIATGKLVFIFN